MSGAEPAAIFAALGDPTRLALVMRLGRERGQSIARLASGTRMSRQAVTKHLYVLERAGLVTQAKIGRESLFTARPDTLDAARVFLDHVSRQWDAALGRLKTFVEDDPG